MTKTLNQGYVTNNSFKMGKGFEQTLSLQGRKANVKLLNTLSC